MSYRIKMKIFFFLFFTSLLLNLTGVAQFPHCLMPGPVIGIAFGDSLLNTREILQKSGIKKIYAYQTSSEKLKTYKSQTTIVNQSGNVESVTTSFPKNEHTKTPWSLFDTILYDDQSRIREIKFTDSKRTEYLQILFDFIGEDELKFSQIVKMQNKQWDTLIDHRYLNKKGQMVKLIQVRKDRPPETSLYYYNADGLLDSVQYENSLLPTIVYKRHEKGKQKIIEAQIQNSKFRWVFNQTGQCTITEITTTYPPRSNYNGVIKSKTEYHYNPDGTLSKVIQKGRDNEKATMYYTYSK